MNKIDNCIINIADFVTNLVNGNAEENQGSSTAYLGLTVLVAGIVAAVGWYLHSRTSSHAERVASEVQRTTIDHPQLQKFGVQDLTQVPELKHFMPRFAATVFNKETEEEEPAYIFSRNGVGESWLYLVSKTNVILGNMHLYHFGKLDPSVSGGSDFGCAALVVQLSSTYSYPDAKEKQEKFEVNELKNVQREKYKYVGYNLIKAALQVHPETDYHVDLNAAWKSHTFYWRLGFRPNDCNETEKVAGWVHKPSGHTDDGILKMYLPQWARLAWRKDIQENPLTTA